MQVIAFYLPQYYTNPENDAWWGRGFTEWTNVTRARPLFKGHYQPHLPSALGFYDLRLLEVQEAQAELATNAGISAFCYYHYWFNGHLLLDLPLNARLAAGRPTLPFLLCWANENWTRTWDGGEDNVLMRQDYSEEDDAEHVRYFVKVMSNEHYFRLGGRPVLLIYRSSLQPDPRRTLDLWRQKIGEAGLGDPYICKVQNFPDDRARAPSEDGFEAGIDWAPDWGALGPPLRQAFPWRLLRKLGLANQTYKYHRLWEYDDLVLRTLRRPQSMERQHPTVCPSWDNSSRKFLGSYMLRGATVESYESWLSQALQTEAREASPHLVFINAWNEWAEGCHLEPDQAFGTAWLEATRRSVQRVVSAAGES